MLGGKPLIVSDCLPQQNLVEKNNCGLVFRNMTEFRDAVIKLINNRELRSVLGKNGMDAILREHNMAKVKENLISLYN
jgi:glycosyltransferase involved in cell wall biosynthesis